jgi:hypothetical protein
LSYSLWPRELLADEKSDAGFLGTLITKAQF